MLSLCQDTRKRKLKNIYSLILKNWWSYYVKIWFLKIKWRCCELFLVYVLQVKPSVPSKIAVVASGYHQGPTHTLGAKHPFPSLPFPTDADMTAGKGCTDVLFPSCSQPRNQKLSVFQDIEIFTLSLTPYLEINTRQLKKAYGVKSDNRKVGSPSEFKVGLQKAKKSALAKSP